MTSENVQDIYELTPMQHGLLFDSVTGGDTGMYLIQLETFLSGALSVPDMERAWALAIERQLLEVHLERYRPDHPVVIEARRNLLRSAWAGGVQDEVVQQSVLWAQASRGQLRSWVLAPRQLGTLGNNQQFVPGPKIVWPRFEIHAKTLVRGS